MSTTNQITTENLASAIEEIMKDTGCNEIEAITAMQGICASLSADEVLEMLCEMKWKLIAA